MSNVEKTTRLSKIAQCIRKTSNTLKLGRVLMPDSDTFNASAVTPEMSAKFTHLIKQIRDLDAEDIKTHKTLFKHFIFTDIRESAFGAKAIASFLISGGFDFRMGLATKYIKRAGKMVQTQSGETLYKQRAGSDGFAILQSLPLWKNPLSVQTKKTILSVFNKPKNSQGELLRIIVLDSKFKEGIDLYDVKYVHLLEPSIAVSDLKQAVGRATRYCGQKRLPFEPKIGWKLHVYVYNLILPNRAPFLLKDKNADKITSHKLMLEKSGLDLALMNLTQDITTLAIRNAVDYALNYNINNFRVNLPTNSGSDLASDLGESFEAYRWPKPIVKNGCEAPVERGKAAVFSKTQDFIRHYFTPERPIKGLLAWHSVGTGKTCMAVAAATTQFEQAGYTILWVTRNALMADVYKNIFGTVCSIPLMDKAIPDDASKQKRLLSKAWLAPISYRTFQNALEKKNELGRTLYRKNPSDPLFKTFLVIDEIHKLHDGDLSVAESADFHKIQNYIFNSYETSGKDSVRPLLMTATPITDSPNELFEIINTLIPNPANRLDLDNFRKDYTDSEGLISEAGKSLYVEKTKGLVSYLNREFDPTTFTQPQFYAIDIVLQSNSDIPSFIDTYMKQIGIDNLITEQMREKDCDADLRVAQEKVDAEITALEKEIINTADKNAKKVLKGKILDLNQILKDAEIMNKTRRKKCEKTNQELAKAEIKTRKAFMTTLISDMKTRYEKTQNKSGSAQLKGLETCLSYKGASDSNDFIKIANEVFNIKS